MTRLLKKLLVLGAALSLAANASAFSLLGPFASWQTSALGFNLVGDIGGPMNLGEEYRFTVPVLTYGYDATFLNFFGSNGIVAMESAMSILNAIPAAGAMSASLAEFPVQALGPVNTTAASLQLIDIKSVAMATMVAQMGLASPERWVYTLRDRTIIQNTTNYTVVQRHFDPVNFRPTNVVNGVLYTYSVLEPLLPGNYADAVETRVSGNANFQSVASVDDGGGLGFGQFFTSLSRDDYGGLRYLLRYNNVQVEDINDAGSISLVNTTSPYAPFTGTNSNTNVVVDVARRPGIEKITFNPIAIDALLGITVRSVTNRYVDTFFHPTNFFLTNQTVQRVTTTPDILFATGDLGLVLGSPFPYSRSTTGRWVDNSTLNSQGGGVGTVILTGPGVIPAATSNATAIVLTFTTLLPSRANFSSAGARFLDERTATLNGVWGFFDTTTIFSIFPDGATIQDLERQLLGR